MSTPLLIALVTLAVVTAASFVWALIAADMPPKIGFKADFVGAFITLAAIAIVLEGLVFGAIRLVRYAWGGG